MTDYLIESVGAWERMTGRRSRRLASLDQAIPRVSIYCASGHDIPWLVASFTLTEPAPDMSADTSTHWSEDGYYPTRSGEGVWIGRRVFRTALVGDAVVPHDQQRDHRFDPDFRLRGKFKCETCGLNVSRKFTEVQKDFNRLWSVGVSEIPLSTYAAIVHSSRSSAAPS